MFSLWVVCTARLVATPNDCLDSIRGVDPDGRSIPHRRSRWRSNARFFGRVVAGSDRGGRSGFTNESDVDPKPSRPTGARFRQKVGERGRGAQTPAPAARDALRFRGGRQAREHGALDMAQNRRHLEFFGPDLLRAPALSGSPPVAAVQIAAAIAQLRAPLSRADSDIEAHADFIRTLAEKLFPDYSVAVKMDVGDEVSNNIDTTIRVDNSDYSLLHCWLADGVGGAPTATAPTSVTWPTGSVVQTLAANKHFLVVTPKTGVLTVTVNNAGAGSYYWAVARFGKVYYSNQLSFA
ncbi:MAG: hypothetical protein D6744_00530 [Planctomycetota bacterium]|nr:MAG: hypothetical protein D6744_00530 [Planctomycetota bacterium]